MARKKSVEAGGNNAPWLNTFADLMNLLLCFFVLLFAYSDVNAEKFNEISISMANSIGVFDAGSTSLGKAQLISSGMSQLSELDKFFSSMGKSVEGESTPTDTASSGQGTNDSQSSDNVLQGKDGTQGSQAQSSENTSQSTNVGIDQAMARLQEEMKNVTTDMYDQISDLSDQYNLGDYMVLSIDPEFHFVQLTLKGSVLYDSGSADIKKAAKSILSRIGEILTNFKGYNVEIVGHTDNVPMNSDTFKDNNWLSSARALNAAEYLIDNCGMDPSTLKYSGRGEYEPVSSNATAEGRANNRRIEIKIYNQYSGN